MNYDQEESILNYISTVFQNIFHPFLLLIEIPLGIFKIIHNATFGHIVKSAKYDLNDL